MTTMTQEAPLETRPDTPLWSENYALVFNDPVNRISALFSLGTWRHDTTVWRENFCITLPDGQVLSTLNYGRNSKGNVASASMARYEIVEPDRKVRLTYNGPMVSHTLDELLQQGKPGALTYDVRLTLDFDARSPMWDMHAGHEKDSTGMAGAMHIEQLGVSSGVLRVNEAEHCIANAFTCRDHSRGARNFNKYRNHCWMSGAFAGGRSFQLYIFKMHGVEGIAMSQAVVSEGGRLYPATVEHVEVVDSLADVRKAQKIVLKSELGEMDIKVAPGYATIPVSIAAPFDPSIGRLREPHAMLFDEAVTMEWNGEKGLGWSERGFSKNPL